MKAKQHKIKILKIASYPQQRRYMSIAIVCEKDTLESGSTGELFPAALYTYDWSPLNEVSGAWPFCIIIFLPTCRCFPCVYVCVCVCVCVRACIYVCAINTDMNGSVVL